VNVCAMACTMAVLRLYYVCTIAVRYYGIPYGIGCDGCVLSAMAVLWYVAI
jgi:hypothetical protein